MRILFQTYSLAFQNPGGGEQVLLALQEELRKMGHVVDVMDSWVTDVSNYDLIHYFSCIETEGWNNWARRFPTIPLVVTPTLAFGTPWQRKSQKIRQQTKGILEWLFHKNLQSRWNRYKIPKLWFPTTLMEADLLCSTWGISPDRIHVLPNGVHENFFKDTKNLSALPMGLSKPYLIHVGRFDPVKNQIHLIKTLRGLGISVVFVGSAGSQFRDYWNTCRTEALSDPASASLFHFLGSLPRNSPELVSLLKNAHLCVLPSNFETFGISALESMATGTPVLMTSRSYAKGQLGLGVTYLCPEDWGLWKKTIQEYMAQPKKTLSAKNIDFIRNHFSWSMIAKQLVGHYERLFRTNSSSMPR